MPLDITHLLDKEVNGELIAGEFNRAVYEAAGIQLPADEPVEAIALEEYRLTEADAKRSLEALEKLVGEARPSYAVSLATAFDALIYAGDPRGEYKMSYDAVTHVITMAERAAKRTTHEAQVGIIAGYMRKLGDLILISQGLLAPETIQHPDNQMLKRKAQVDTFLENLEGMIDARSESATEGELKSVLDFAQYGHQIGLSLIVPEIERRITEVYKGT